MSIDDDTVVLCMPWSAPSPFRDDVRASCMCCGRAVRHRPHVPKGAKPMCMPCYTLRASPDDMVSVTEETRNEAAAHLSRKLH
ncbi:hypothetical protein [Azospirillum sp. sgz302134]